jgi:TRAP-type C4-dicarboxylate transport system substrate-binding protein
MTAKPLIPLLAVALLAGCGSEHSDRAGGDKAVKAKVLVMANANDNLGELEAFDQAVGRVSGGQLRIEWHNEYARGQRGNAEVNVIRAVAAGKVDLGWAGSRIFDSVGIRAFSPLHAPLLVDSYALEEKVLGDGLADPMLHSLGAIDLQGIGVLPGPLRRPLGRRPLRGPEDWAGARIAWTGGEQNAEALRLLGAKPVYDNPGIMEPTDGLAGVETYIAAIGGNHYQRAMPYLTGNVVLWPRWLVLFAAPNVSADDLAVLRRAAKEAIPDVAATARSQESEQLAELCRSTLRVVSASPQQIDGLRAALRPISDELERDPATQQTTARIEELARGAGTSAVPVRCPAASKRATNDAIPPGTYRTVITRADAKEHGWPWSNVVEEDPDPKALQATTKENRLEFTDEGAFTVYDVWLDGTANIGWEGTYSVYRDRITVKGNEGTTITARVKVDGDRLRFTDVQPGPKTPEALTWGSKPFVKIR